MGLLSGFCHELAAFDGHKANMDGAKLQRQLFGHDTNVRAFLAYLGEEAIGFILCYECFTVYSGERGLYVPGAYIIEKYRHRGYGVKLFRHVAAYGLSNGFEFMNWIVEDGNDRANAIYRKMGAQISNGWSYVRVPKDVMENAVRKIRAIT